ncbi:B12-binding domain-containing radical SAM protein [Candidatus Latescibacterota bacterium]
MKLLLINPNRYRTPPAPPLGLEYLENALRDSPHECRILDLCFEDNPSAALDDAINGFTPDIAGMSIRNIDTVICHNNLFFLDEIKLLVDHVKKKGVPVILGGVGFSFIPEGILLYIGADWGVKGPGERGLRYILDNLEINNEFPLGTVLDGWEMEFDPDMRVLRGDSIDYGRYFADGALAGFQTQTGCMERCTYCSEGTEKVRFRNPDRIIEELNSLVSRGFTDFHLCDTEFNQDIDFCHTFLKTLIAKGTEISWTLYMKSFPYDDDIFRLLRKSGANLITLSIPTGNMSMENAENIIGMVKKYEMRIAVDFLCGFPGEKLDSVKRTIDRFREIRPDTVGINSTFRLYPGNAITRKVMESPNYRNNLSGDVNDNPHLIRPVFYSHINVEMLHIILPISPVM